MRIMTGQYIRKEADEKKFCNRSETDVASLQDPEYVRYQEQRTNTQKMQTILKSLNSPQKKRKTIQSMRDKLADEREKLKAKQVKSNPHKLLTRS